MLPAATGGSAIAPSAPRLSIWVLSAALVAHGCADPGRESVHDWTLRERVRRVEVGASVEQARAILGREPVRRPGHPTDPFPSPHRTLRLGTAEGAALQVELYVVAAQPAPGCPDVVYEDVPIVFRDGRVAGKGWEFVESHWRGWGGSLAALREARDGTRCPGSRPSP